MHAIKDKIIFLDIDGVLNSMPYLEKHPKSDLNPDNIKRLAQIQKTTDARIILCSTWKVLNDPKDPRCYAVYKRLLKTLNEYDLKITGATPETQKGRPCDIHEYLRQHPAEQFVILDDDYPEQEYEVYGLKEHLIKTRYFCTDEKYGGLQDSHVEKAIDILL